MKLNDVLLGLVKLHPGVTGYELRRIITQSTQYFMNAQLSQIYPALKQMTAEGLMAFDEFTTEGGRQSKRYTLSKKGEERYFAWLREPLDFAPSMNSRRQFMLKLVFIGSLPRGEQVDFVQNALDYYRYEYDELMTGSLDVEDSYLAADLPEHDDVMLYWSWEARRIREQSAEMISWLEAMLRELEAR